MRGRHQMRTPRLRPPFCVPPTPLGRGVPVLGAFSRGPSLLYCVATVGVRCVRSKAAHAAQTLSERPYGDLRCGRRGSGTAWSHVRGARVAGRGSRCTICRNKHLQREGTAHLASIWAQGPLDLPCEAHEFLLGVGLGHCARVLAADDISHRPRVAPMHDDVELQR